METTLDVQTVDQEICHRFDAPPTALSFAEQYKNSVEFGADTIFLTSASYRAPDGDAMRIRVHIGSDWLIGCEFVFESNQGTITVGDRTFLNGGSRLIARNRIGIGTDVMIVWGCWVYDHDSHSLDWRDRRADIMRQNSDCSHSEDLRKSKDWNHVASAPIQMCDKVWIGFDAVILKGVTIGEGAIVGARSVVTQNVDPWTIVAGNPARVVKHLVVTSSIEPKRIA